jgi:dTDP-4-amino-4,6-dideoxygalactose transaminase
MDEDKTRRSSPDANGDFIPFSRPVLGEAEEQAVLEVMRSGWLTTGKVATAFETEFAAYVGAPHALAVNSATAGLHLALEAMGVGPGDVCAVPDYTFTATAEVVRYLGADPVFIDSGISANLDLDKLEAVLKTTRVKVVLPVHLAGEPVDWERLAALRDRYGFWIVEDAAHVIPARGPHGYYGALGDIGVYSFYANKNMTTGEGGMIVTRNEDWARRMRIMRLHGIDRDAFARFTSQAASWEYAVVAPGFKYNMTDLAAAIGRVQLTRAEGFWRDRQALVRRYLAQLKAIPELELPVWRDDHAWHVFSILLPPQVDRASFIRDLTAASIGTSVHYIPLHRMPYWREQYALKDTDFPQAEARYRRTVSLPLYPALTEAQVDRVCAQVRRLLEAH